MSVEIPDFIPFINRRKGQDRREEHDPCGEMDVDLFHRKRRVKPDRRQDRRLDEDYYAYVETLISSPKDSN